MGYSNKTLGSTFQRWFLSVPRWLVIVIFGVISNQALAGEFTEESEKDFPLRSNLGLQVINAKGDINVQGWAFDKIRLKIRKQVNTETPEKAKQLLSGIDYRYQVSDEKIEISNQYGSHLGIQERLQEKEISKARIDFTLYAPSKLKLKIWSVDGRITLKAWHGATEVRSNSGLIQMDGVKGESTSVICSTCSAYLKNVHGNLHCFGRSGLFNLNNIDGKKIFVETDSGGIKLSHIQGDQLYISQTGFINGQFLAGKVEYHASQATVDLREISGVLSGSSESGSVNGTIREWKTKDETLIESVQGNISLALPRFFSAEVDLWSVQGQTKIDFPLETAQELSTFGPEPANHLMGQVREGGALLKIFSDTGNISVIKR